MRKPFSFGLVRYVHDPVSGEFLNVGVAVYSPAGHYIKSRCTRRYARLSCTFGDVPGAHFRSLMEYVEQRVNKFGLKVSTGAEELPEGPVELFSKLFAIDDSSLQFANGGGGLADDLDAALNRLYDRFVGQFESGPPKKKADSDVWRETQPVLERFGVVKHLTTYRVFSDLDSYKFDHAFKNGSWNALEPISFDLASERTIRDKANKWLGRTVNLADSAGDLKLYYLLGRPELASMKRAYGQAKDILHKSPIPHMIVEEDDVADVAAELRDKIRAHEAPELGLDESL